MGNILYNIAQPLTCLLVICVLFVILKHYKSFKLFWLKLRIRLNTGVVDLSGNIPARHVDLWINVFMNWRSYGKEEKI